MSPRISMITLGVRDLEVAINFYVQGLGFPRKKSSPDIAFFTLNGTWLALYNWDAFARDAGVDSSGVGFGGFTLSHNVMSEKEVDKVYAAAVAAEASPVKKPQPASWGGYSGYFNDLDGICGKWRSIHSHGLNLRMRKPQILKQPSSLMKFDQCRLTLGKFSKFTDTLVRLCETRSY